MGIPGQRFIMFYGAIIAEVGVVKESLTVFSTM